MIIINADDFGLNLSCTNAICEAFQKELITDSTMVANGDAFQEALTVIKSEHLEEKIGIHFNLTEKEPLSASMKHCKRFVADGEFTGNINRFKPLSKFQQKTVYEEFCAQVERLQKSGILLTHADSHHHIHTAVFIAPIFARVCHKYGIQKVRLHRNFGCISSFKMVMKKKYNQWLHKQGFHTTQFFGSVKDIQIAGIPDGLTEIMVHPDYSKDGALIDKICEIGDQKGNPLSEIKVVIGDIRLTSYAEIVA